MPSNPEFDDDTVDPMTEEDAGTDDPESESISGTGEDDDDAMFEDEEDDEMDEDALDDEEPTAEVGSEGGSPGDTTARRARRVGQTQGSEATESWGPLDNEPVAVSTTDDTGTPRRRA